MRRRGRRRIRKVKKKLMTQIYFDTRDIYMYPITPTCTSRVLGHGKFLTVYITMCPYFYFCRFFFYFSLSLSLSLFDEGVNIAV